MQTAWQNYLLQHGAQLDAQERLFFGQAPRDEIALVGKTNHLVCLDHYGVIHVSGEDAQAFLQAQFSNDIKLANATQSQWSAYCNPKGRILAHFLILPDDQTYYLICPRDIIEVTLKRLSMYVLRSKVVLDDVSETKVCLGFVGDAAKTGFDLPTHEYQITASKQQLTTKLPAPIQRYLALMPLQDAQTLWPALSQHFTPGSHHVWNWLDIQAGLPTIREQTREEFVPQMVNLELLNAVNFKKGCYPGQEIVARMHYLGKPKRRMFALHSGHDTPPPPGTDLYIKGGDGQSVGMIVLSEPAQKGGIDMLAVIRLPNQNNEQLQLATHDAPLSVGELPYPLDLE